MVLRNVRTKLRRLTAAAMLSVSAIALVISMGGSAFAATTQNNRQQLFEAAAQEFKVPKEVLMALSYNQSRWESHAGLPSNDGGFGLMNLRTYVNKGGGRDGVTPTGRQDASFYTLDRAARLLGIPADQLKTNDAQNIRGAAAVLAEEARQLNGGIVPIHVGDWYGAISEYSGSVDPQTAQSFADSVFDSLQSGLSLTTNDGQKLQLNALKGLSLNKQPIQSLLAAPEAQDSLKARQNNPWKPECPTGLDCRFIPAAYTQNNPQDPADYGNYDPANRPKDMKIKYIVIHDTEGSYDSAISWFQNPASYVSCNYVIRSSDGQITQMVQNQGVAWCAGDWYVNMHSINIEHEGVAAEGAAWYTEAMYQSSAKLVKYLSKKYDIPLDREHVIGHDNVPSLSAARLAGQHYDPGPYWDWNHYMALLHNRTDDAERRFEAASGNKIVTISPKTVGHVYLHTQPNAVSPLLTDPILHPGGEPGTTNIEDWSATAATGQKFAVADKQGDWTAVWFGNQKGWFYNPSGPNQIAYSSSGKTITPKAGKTSIDVYGGAYPEASAYPSTIPVQSAGPIYSIKAGQKYVSGGNVPTDYFYDATINWSLPDDHMIVQGNEKYLQITYNHRIAYVKANDVNIQ